VRRWAAGLAISLTVAACGAAVAPTQVAGPFPTFDVPRPTASPKPLSAVLGQQLLLPGLGSLTVMSFTEWLSKTDPGPGYRFLTLKLDLSATAAWTLGGENVVLTDRSSGGRYGVSDQGRVPILKLPLSITPGNITSGYLTFKVSRASATFSLWLTGLSGLASAVVIELADPLPPDLATVAAAYLKTVTAYNSKLGSVIKLWNAAGCSQSKLGAAWAAFVADEEAWVAAIKKVLFPESIKGLASELIESITQDETAARKVAGNPLNKYLLYQRSLTQASVTADAVLMRQKLGLPPITADSKYDITNSCALP
jgi:hypothetical protein